MIIVKKPKIRFKGFTETWEQRKLGDIVDRVTRKNTGLISNLPLTISAQYGLIDQNVFFDRRVASKDISGYYLINNGEFAYNKSTSVDAPWGAIKRLNRYENGVLSTLYIVFKIKNNNDVNSDFLVSYYDTNMWHKGISEIATEGARNHGLLNISPNDFFLTRLFIPCMIKEQEQIGSLFSKLDNLITLHQCKHFTNCNKNRFAWEQRKAVDLAEYSKGNGYSKGDLTDVGTPIILYGRLYTKYQFAINEVDTFAVPRSGSVYSQGNEVIVPASGETAEDIARASAVEKSGVLLGGDLNILRPFDFINPLFLALAISNGEPQNELAKKAQCKSVVHIHNSDIQEVTIAYPSRIEQDRIVSVFRNLDRLITLHQHKLNILKDIKKYMIFGMLNIEGGKNMPELESIIEKNLIDQLVLGDSQWTYRADLKSEKDLWDNFRYILEQNNKDRLNGQPLSDNEFEQVKNQLQFSSFYKAGEWLVGENGKVMVHVQRDTEKLHLVVMNHEHIAGGSSVYEVINQYSTLQSDKENGKDNNSRFDVTLMINGLPMIHIELKNKSHPYMEAFNQIKRYIGEGKFTGIFSAVQMFVVSNGVDTKYFSAASDTELNPKFMSGWLDEKNNPVTDYIDFAKSVLSIPQAHEMIARYTVLDEDSKRLILLRPYQIHAIEAIRESSKQGKSGYVWHTTGSGKTLTSYKATRNLLMDIPSIDKTIFLIDRKDFDAQTTLAFQAYANNDLVDVDETENVNDLKKKLKSDDRQVIVTTIQKLQRLVTKRLKEDTPEYLSLIHI